DAATAKKNAKAVYDLETRLAKASRKLAALRDPEKNYNKWSVSKLSESTGNFQWPMYLQKIGINKLDSVIVGQPEFYTALNNELKKTSIEDWKNYLRFHLVRVSAPYLDAQTFNNYFDYRKTLSGQKAPRARWKRVLDSEEDAIGE